MHFAPIALPAPGPAGLLASPFQFRTTDCDECGGSGEVTQFASYAGEAYAGEFLGGPCDECNGTGEEDAACANCATVRPLDDEGFCQPCFAEINGPFGVGA